MGDGPADAKLSMPPAEVGVIVIFTSGTRSRSIKKRSASLVVNSTDRATEEHNLLLKVRCKPGDDY